ncbi:MAG: hypothetical protein WAL91_09770, partial [Propionicimonas sp.]
MVTSPTTRRARGDRPGSLRRCLRAGTALLLAGCLLGGLAPSARAEDLNDAQDQVRKALVKAKAEIASDKAALAEAADKLAASQAELARARSALVAVKRKLKAARDADAQVAADLAAAEAA